jgi:hypothetical protein
MKRLNGWDSMLLYSLKSSEQCNIGVHAASLRRAVKRWAGVSRLRVGRGRVLSLSWTRLRSALV